MAYSKQFKEQAVGLVTTKGYDPARAARELGMPTSTLRIWLAKAGWRRPPVGGVAVEGDAGPPLGDDPAVLRAQVQELRRQVKRLEVEKDILKKATAFFASQNP